MHEIQFAATFAWEMDRCCARSPKRTGSSLYQPFQPTFGVSRTVKYSATGVQATLLRLFINVCTRMAGIEGKGSWKGMAILGNRRGEVIGMTGMSSASTAASTHGVFFRSDSPLMSLEQSARATMNDVVKSRP